MKSVKGIFVYVFAVLLLFPGAGIAQEDGGLTIGIPQDQYRLEGDRANLGVYPFNANITETLVRLTPDFDIVPGLAERWENVGDNTWRFYLREGVDFHDGTELTAEAVKFSLDRAARAGGSIPLDEDSTQVVDTYTVDITPTLPFFNRVIDNLVHPLYGIYAPTGDPGSNPIGTGPFALESYERNEQLVVTRNPDYWGDAPVAERITFKFIPEGSTRALALQAGDVDMVTNVPKEMIGFIENLPGLNVFESAPASYVALYLVSKTDGDNDILQDVHLRKAINSAIDRQEIVETVWGGYALPAKTLIPPAVFGAIDEQVEGYAYDPERARALISEAGWTFDEASNAWTKDGETLEVRLVAGFPPARLIAPLPEVLKGQLEAVQNEYVEAARALGVPHARIIWRHILPNVLSPVVVLATLDLGYIILAISSLSFLGLGAQAPTPEWGRMLSDAAPYMQFAPRLMVVPGAAIFMVVLACNLLGDGLRDMLDPKSG